MNCRLTPLKHSDIADIAETIIPPSELKPDFKGSHVEIVLEPNEYANKDGKFFDGDRLAILVVCKGKKLGYLPELYSVTEWKREHDAWTRAVEAIRNQLSLEYTLNGTERWSGHVAACRYISTEGGVTRYLEYPEYSILSPDKQKTWTLEQVAIAFPVEVL